jgi:polyisoprenoid-binding protein YceI
LNLTTKLLAAGATLAVVALVALGALWYFVFNSDAPGPVSIEEAAAAAGSQSQAPADGDLTGEWTVVQGDSSFAGYRVNQQVAGIGGETVVGRTQGVQGSFNFDGAAINGLEVTADMTGLRSDESLRDNVLRSEAIETANFPTATFVLTEPVPVGAVPAEGERIAQTVTGELTLHGVTQPIEMNVEAVLQGGQLIVVGSQEIEMADFGITPPRGPASVLSVEDHGVMEVQLVFAKGGQAPAQQPAPARETEPAGSSTDAY